MKPWLIDFTQKQILIVGGGPVAYRKAKSFIDELACVSVIAPSFIETFNELNCTKIQKKFVFDDLKGFFMVYAATSNQILNQEIVTQAKANGILCGSATSSNSDLKSMAVVETKEMILALSCKHTYPHFLHYIEENLKKYDDLLEKLTHIREYSIMNDLVFESDRSLFFKYLMYFSLEELQKIYVGLVFGYMDIHIYTGHLEDTAINFSSKLNAMTLSYRDPHFLEKCQAIDLMDIDVTIQPMVVYYGKIYDSIVASFKDTEIRKPLFSDPETLKQIFKEKKNRLFLVHSRSNNEFIEMLSQYGMVHEFEKPLLNKEYDAIIPFILQEGYHYHHDILHLPIDKLEPVLLKNKNIKRHIIKVIKKHTF